jgi:hypothetical protein
MTRQERAVGMAENIDAGLWKGATQGAEDW